MEIIPAIDLLAGNCVRLNKGDYQQVTQFNTDPVSQALKWQDDGAKRLHLVDLDGAKTGQPVNDSSIRSVIKSLDIPVQLGGGIRSVERVDDLLSFGLDRVILGTIAIESPELVVHLANKYPKRIVIGIDSNDGKVATHGWIKQSDLLATDLAKELSNTEIAAIIATDIATDGTLLGPNLEAMKEIALASNVPVIASGGIGSISDLISLMSLEHYGITGVIIGRALYSGEIDLREAIKVSSNYHLQDPLSKDSFLS